MPNAQRRENQGVGLLNPLHLRAGDAEILDDGGDRHVDNRRVNNDERDGQTDEQQAEPPGAR